MTALAGSFNEEAAGTPASGLPKQEFFAAIRANDLPAVQGILKKHPGAIDWRYETTEFTTFEDGYGLHISAAEGFTGITKALLDAGANPDAGDGYGQTSLCLAVEGAKVQDVRLLLQHKANPNFRLFDGRRPFIIAARVCSVPVMRLLAKAGADVHACLDGGENALMRALEDDAVNKKVLRFLLNRKVDGTQKGGTMNRNAAEHARALNKHELAQFIEEYPAERDRKDKERREGRGKRLADSLTGGTGAKVEIKSPLRLKMRAPVLNFTYI
jgi:hypothetical protein